MVARSPLALLVLLLHAVGWLAGALLAQTPHAVFEPAVAYVSNGPRDVTAGDVDGDGHLDLLVSQDMLQGPTRVLLGLGDGSFTDVGAVPGSLSVFHHWLLDLDGDGDPELLERAAAQLRVRHALPGFAFDAPVVLIDGSNTPWPEPYDLDGDGDLDLVVGEAGSTTLPTPGVHVLWNDGAGSFSAGPVLPVTGGARWVAVGHLDHDGIPDLALATFGLGGGSLEVALGLGGGTFGATTLVAPFVTPPPITDIHLEQFALADLDLDGELDLLRLDVMNDVLITFAGLGDGSFAPMATSGLTPVVSATACVALADVTRDGVLDALIANNFLNELLVYAGDGAGGFTASLVADDLGGPSEVITADLDEDGVLDVAITDTYDESARVLLNHTYGPGSPFVDLGGPLGGPDGGRPILMADGTPVYGEPIAFALAEGRPLATSGLVLGVSRLDAPFKGGVMVPFPDVVLGPVPLDAQGRCTLAGPWLGLSGGWDFWAQWWIVDPIGPKGFTASTTVQVSVP